MSAYEYSGHGGHGKRTIIWEKWVDPMGTRQDDDLDEFVREEHMSDYEKSETEERKASVYRVRPAALTNFGVIPINTHNDPAKAFDYWVGHTDFYIGEKTAEIIDGTPGVEIFDLFSGYRFRISVGKAFNFRDVRVALETRLHTLNPPKLKPEETQLPLDLKLKEKILTKIGEIKELSSYWIIYVLPNSELEVSLPKDPESFKHRKQILLDTRELAGGFVLASDEYS